MIFKFCEYIDFIIGDIKKYKPGCSYYMSSLEIIKSKFLKNIMFDHHDLRNINDIIINNVLLDSSVQWQQLNSWKYLNFVSLYLESKLTYRYDVGIICSVRTGADKEYIEEYVESLEKMNIRVFYPGRDTTQEDPEGGIRICRDNQESFKSSYEIHVIFHPESQGSLFDLGMCFDKPIHVVNPIIKTEKKSFKNVLLFLDEENKNRILFNIDFNKEIEIR